MTTNHSIVYIAVESFPLHSIRATPSAKHQKNHAPVIEIVSQIVQHEKKSRAQPINPWKELRVFETEAKKMGWKEERQNKHKKSYDQAYEV